MQSLINTKPRVIYSLQQLEQKSSHIKSWLPEKSFTGQLLKQGWPWYYWLLGQIFLCCGLSCALYDVEQCSWRLSSRWKQHHLPVVKAKNSSRYCWMVLGRVGWGGQNRPTLNLLLFLKLWAKQCREQYWNIHIVRLLVFKKTKNDSESGYNFVFRARGIGLCL